MAEAKKTVTESDNLAGAVTTIQYKKSQNDAVSEVQSASVLTETIQDQAQARKHRQSLFWILVFSALSMLAAFLGSVCKIFSLLTLEVSWDETPVIFLGNNGWLLEIILVVLASVAVILFLAAVRLANREKETVQNEAKDGGIIARLMSEIVDLLRFLIDKKYGS